MSTKTIGLVWPPLLLFGCIGSTNTSTPQDTNALPTPSEELKDSATAEDTGTDGDTDTEAPLDTSSSYTFSDAESLLYVQVFKDPDTLLAAFAHDHVIRATQWSGNLAYDIENPSACELSFSLPVGALIPDEDQMRSLVGYDGSLSSSDREAIKGHMLDAKQLNGSKFSKIEFSSNKCSGPKGANSGTLNVEGKLKILGVPVNVKIPVDFSIKNKQFYAKGRFEISMWDFGMEPYSAYSGGVRNEEGLFFSFDMAGAAN